MDLSGYRAWATGLSEAQAEAKVTTTQAGTVLKGTSFPAVILTRTVGTIGETEYTTCDVYFNDGTVGGGLGTLTAVVEA